MLKINLAACRTEQQLSWERYLSWRWCRYMFILSRWQGNFRRLAVPGLDWPRGGGCQNCRCRTIRSAAPATTDGRSSVDPQCAYAESLRVHNFSFNSHENRCMNHATVNFTVSEPAKLLLINRTCQLDRIVALFCFPFKMHCKVWSWKKKNRNYNTEYWRHLRQPHCGEYGEFGRGTDDCRNNKGKKRKYEYWRGGKVVIVFCKNAVPTSHGGKYLFSTISGLSLMTSFGVHLNTKNWMKIALPM